MVISIFSPITYDLLILIDYHYFGIGIKSSKIQIEK